MGPLGSRSGSTNGPPAIETSWSTFQEYLDAPHSLDPVDPSNPTQIDWYSWYTQNLSEENALQSFHPETSPNGNSHQSHIPSSTQVMSFDAMVAQSCLRQVQLGPGNIFEGGSDARGLAQSAVAESPRITGYIPTFFKGPMVESLHQAPKLTPGQLRVSLSTSLLCGLARKLVLRLKAYNDLQSLSGKKLRALEAQKRTAFHPFPRLPLELRYMIYDFMIPDRRVIEIKETKPYNRRNDRDIITVLYDFPAVFYISGEARDWATRAFNYKLAFGANLQGRAIYYDPLRDSLLFHDLRVFEKFFNTDFGSRMEVRTKVDKSKTIEAPLFLAVNRAWEMCINPRSYKILGQPKNIVLARSGGGDGRMDMYAKQGIEDQLVEPTAVANGIIPPETVRLMTFKTLRDEVEKLNRPPPAPRVPVLPILHNSNGTTNTAGN
ncbi:hypothetical protein VTL71DRAFT_10376 [Oculimacula yallundae]|uniref:2EXR domain-containing protein n=1 Tax=Oculimacula yallundae TaxID=86028 RepID=A0ABR4CU01_9HELO